MPFLETLDDVVENLADQLGIYEDPRCVEPADDRSCWGGVCPQDFDDPGGAEEPGAHCHLSDAPDGYWLRDHVDGCDCRVHWAPRMRERLEAALRRELALESAGLLR